MNLFLKKSISIALCISMIGCTSHPVKTTEHEPLKTNHTLNDKVSDSKQFNGEYVTHFFITKNGEQLLVAGSKHHFLLPLDKNLREIFLWESRYKIAPYFADVEDIDGENFKLTYTANVFNSQTKLTSNEISFLKNHQFKEHHYGYSLKKTITGQYYQANDIDLSGFNAFKLNYPLHYKGGKPMHAINPSEFILTLGGSLIFLGVALVIYPITQIINSIDSMTSKQESRGQ